MKAKRDSQAASLRATATEPVNEGDTDLGLCQESEEAHGQYQPNG